MNWSPSLSGNMVRPNGPALLPQRPMEHLDPILSSGPAQPRDRPAGRRVRERVTAVPPFSEQPAAATGEALDTVNDGVGHAGP